jgi:hypothetical protein
MIVFVALTIYGAALGLSTRPWMRAVVIASVSVGAVQYSAIRLSGFVIDRSDMADLASTVQGYVGSGARDLLPTVLAAGFAAGFAAFVRSMFRPGEPRRRPKFSAVVEDRAIHTAAADRINRLMDH